MFVCNVQILANTLLSIIDNRHVLKVKHLSLVHVSKNYFADTVNVSLFIKKISNCPLANLVLASFVFR